MRVENRQVVLQVTSDLERGINLLRTLAVQLERVFVPLYESLPGIERDVLLTRQETELLLRQLFTAEGTKRLPITEILHEVQGRLQEALGLLMAQDEVTDMFTSVVAEGGDQGDFKSVLALIQRISVILEDIRDMAVNAIIFAARLDEGAAFTIISQELSKTSTVMKSSYDEFHATFSELRDWYNVFTEEVMGKANIQRDRGEQLQAAVASHFAQLIGSLEQIAYFMGDLVKHGEQALGPVESIMTAIQVQDIIRQQTDNLANLLSSGLSTVRGLAGGSEDHALFILQSLRLGARLMENISGTLEDFLDNLRDLVVDLNHSVQDVEENMELVAEVFLGAADHPGTIKTVFALITDTVDYLRSVVVEVNRQNQELDRGRDMLHEMLDSSSSYFAAISKGGVQISRLALLAKLELGRLDTPDAQAFADQLDQMVAGIQGGIKDTRQAYGDMEDSIQRVIIGGGQVLRATYGHLTEMLGAIDRSGEELTIVQKLTRDSIEALVHGFKEMRESLAAVQKGLASHRQLLDMAWEAETCLNDGLKRLAASNIVDEGVSLSNDQLAELMEHFTSYVERQVTQDLFTHEQIDIGSQGGELELF
jgi:methyl-accepting chemotaxis protein